MTYAAAGAGVVVAVLVVWWALRRRSVGMRRLQIDAEVMARRERRRAANDKAEADAVAEAREAINRAQGDPSGVPTWDDLGRVRD